MPRPVAMRRSDADPAWVANALVQGGCVRVGEPDLAELIRCLRLVHHDAGTILYNVDVPPRGVTIIRSGCVELSQGVGTHRRVVALMKSGDVLGDVALLQDAPPPFTARCIEATIAWFLTADDFRRLVATYPSIAVGWLCSLATRLTRSRRVVADILGSDLAARIARLLLREATDGQLTIPQATIAQMLGAQRTSVSRILNQFERDGLVELAYSKVSLQDPGTLEAIAHTDGVSAVTRDGDRLSGVAARSVRWRSVSPNGDDARLPRERTRTSDRRRRHDRRRRPRQGSELPP